MITLEFCFIVVSDSLEICESLSDDDNDDFSERSGGGKVDWEQYDVENERISAQLRAKRTVDETQHSQSILSMWDKLAQAEETHGTGAKHAKKNHTAVKHDQQASDEPAAANTTHDTTAALETPPLPAIISPQPQQTSGFSCNIVERQPHDATPALPQNESSSTTTETDSNKRPMSRFKKQMLMKKKQ